MNRFEIETRANTQIDTSAPIVVRTVTGNTHVWFPKGFLGSDDEGHFTGVLARKCLVPDRKVRPQKTYGADTWKFAREHTMQIIESLSEWTPLTYAYFQFSSSQKCNVHCIGARQAECICSCAGDGHGKGSYGATYWKDRQTVTLPGRRLERLTLINQGEGSKMAEVPARMSTALPD